MPAAGYCTQCRRHVWVSPTGECQFGHPSASVHSHYEGQPAESGECTPAPSRSWLLWVLLGLASLGLVAAVFFMGMAFYLAATRVAAGPSQVAQATESEPRKIPLSIPAEWKARAEKDYPGWRVVGYESFGDEYAQETDYVLRLIPPGRDFSVGVLYISRQGHAPYSTDEILRPAGRRNSLAPSLLDHVESSYIGQDKLVEWIESESNGDVYINWNSASSNNEGDVDCLIFTVDKEWVPAL